MLDELAVLLGRTRAFAGLGEPDLAALARAMREISYPPGTLVFGRGDPGTHIYLVREGRVKLSVVTAEGRELSFREARAGDLLGEIAALDGGPRTADATAIGAVRLAALASADIRTLMADHPGIMRAVLGLLCGRLRDTTEQLESIALFPIEARLARFLLAFPATRTPAGETVMLGMSQSDLALLLGATRPKVNAALKALEDEGVVTRAGDGLILDRARLEDRAAGPA